MYYLYFHNVGGYGVSPDTPEWILLREYKQRSSARKAMKRRMDQFGFPATEYRIETFRIYGS